MPEKETRYGRDVINCGLNVWYKKPDARPEVDVIAVQGLDAKPWHTWAYHPKKPPSWIRLPCLSNKKKEAGPMWLEDLLPRSLKNTLVASFSYVSCETLRDVSQLLLNILLQHELDKEKRPRSRPLVLIGHSLGGLVIQQALVTAILQKDFDKIRPCIKGIIFLGVPFQGSDTAGPGEWMARAAKAAGRTTSNYVKLIQSLKRNDVELLHMSRDFWANYNDLDIVCYYETMDAAYGPWKTRVVNAVSGTYIGKRMIPLSTNHSGLNKFSGPDDKNFRLLLPEIERMVKQRPPILVARRGTYGDIVESCSMIPFDYNEFIGREQYLQELDEKLSLGRGDNRAALVGDRGCGKTKIAIEFAVRFRRKHSRMWVFWVHGDSESTFERSYRILAKTAKIPGREDSRANILGLVSEWLKKESTQPWLMIVDNIKDADLFAPQQMPSSSNPLAAKPGLDDYIPKSRNSAVLFITKRGEIGSRLCGEKRNIKVGAMSIEDARKLLHKILPGRKYNGDRVFLAEELGCLPLAMIQAAAAISKYNLTISAYLRRFEKLDAREDIVIRTGMLSFDLVKKWEEREERRRSEKRRRKGRLWGRQKSESKSPATDLLSLISFLHCHGIPRRILLGTDPVGFTKAMILLRSFRLVDTHISGELEIHSCLQDSTKMRIPDDEIEAFRTKALELVSAALQVREYEDYEDLELCQQLLPHAEAVLAHGKKNSTLHDINLSENIAIFKLIVGKYQEANEWAKTVSMHIKHAPRGDEQDERVARLKRLRELISQASTQDRDRDSSQFSENQLNNHLDNLEKKFQTLIGNHNERFADLREGLDAVKEEFRNLISNHNKQFSDLRQRLDNLVHRFVELDQGSDTTVRIRSHQSS